MFIFDYLDRMDVFYLYLKNLKNKKKFDPLVYITLTHTKIMIQIEYCHCHCCQYKHVSLIHRAGSAALICWPILKIIHQQKINLAKMGCLTRGLWLQLA